MQDLITVNKLKIINYLFKSYILLEIKQTYISLQNLITIKNLFTNENHISDWKIHLFRNHLKEALIIDGHIDVTGI